MSSKHPRQNQRRQRARTTKHDEQDTPQEKIPRPMNCFMAFRLEKQSEILENCHGANHRDISKVIAKWWKEMSDEEKAPYRERARLASIEHKKRYPNYKYQPQKRELRSVRKYTRHKKDGVFTSRIKFNNTIMEYLYERGPNAKGDSLSMIGSPVPDSPGLISYDNTSSIASSPACTPPTEPSSPQWPASPTTCSAIFDPPPVYQVPIKVEPMEDTEESPASDAVYEAFVTDLFKVEADKDVLVDNLYDLIFPFTFEKPCIDPRMLDIQAPNYASETLAPGFAQENYRLSYPPLEGHMPAVPLPAFSGLYP
ncbi:hypothetical protein BCR43DRAFT_11448 [Syncephalastrum racemosum]|uniref:HMG box domain-containing protein n=1 Tax=Syncephalastrum racemosum TaxID=13706 RepID=A0A1X2HSC5_SYNRA|nr:hypothetical protein BCR43DRAFT_11448 [Syncephalastrum racemosum]